MKVEAIESSERNQQQLGLIGGIGSGGNNRNTGGGGNDGGSQPDFYIAEAETYPSNKFRIAMFFLLLVVLMTFGGLIGAYIVVSTNGVLEWRPFDLPVQVWISTFLILASSVTFQIAKTALNQNNQTKSKNFLLATTVFGGIFIASQLLAWVALVQRGVYMESNPYAGFFYILTAVHAIHVIGGIIALGYTLLRNWELTASAAELEKRQQISSSIGWYWHFMDGLWIVLVLLLGFWK